jgi:hypothetical protein
MWQIYTQLYTDTYFLGNLWSTIHNCVACHNLLLQRYLSAYSIFIVEHEKFVVSFDFLIRKYQDACVMPEIENPNMWLSQIHDSWSALQCLKNTTHIYGLSRTGINCMDESPLEVYVGSASQ